jgi:hypothetical protein
MTTGAADRARLLATLLARPLHVAAFAHHHCGVGHARCAPPPATAVDVVGRLHWYVAGCG